SSPSLILYCAPPLPGYHHSLPSSPYSTGPEGQRLPSSGTMSSEFLNQGVPAKILLLVCNAAGTGQQAVSPGGSIKVSSPTRVWESPSLSFSFKRLAVVDQTTPPSRSQQMTAGRLVRAKVKDVGVADF
ncbi:hypothetical protein FQN60_004338, partial [Etheostoma spectabile]